MTDHEHQHLLVAIESMQRNGATEAELCRFVDDTLKSDPRDTPSAPTGAAGPSRRSSR